MRAALTIIEFRPGAKAVVEPARPAVGSAWCAGRFPPHASTAASSVKSATIRSG